MSSSVPYQRKYSYTCVSNLLFVHSSALCFVRCFTSLSLQLHHWLQRAVPAQEQIWNLRKVSLSMCLYIKVSQHIRILFEGTQICDTFLCVRLFCMGMYRSWSNYSASWTS